MKKKRTQKEIKTPFGDLHLEITLVPTTDEKQAEIITDALACDVLGMQQKFLSTRIANITAELECLKSKLSEVEMQFSTSQSSLVKKILDMHVKNYR